MGDYDKNQDGGSSQGQTDEEIIQEKLRRAGQEGGPSDRGDSGNSGDDQTGGKPAQ